MKHPHVSRMMKQAVHDNQFTQLEMAKKMGWGSGQYVNNILRGQCSLPVKKLRRFSRVSGVDIHTVIDACLNDQRARLEKLNRVEPSDGQQPVS